MAPDMSKPHKGAMTGWRKITISPPCEEHLGYYIVGVFHGHDKFHGDYGQTSMVVAEFPELNMVETLNSRYTLEYPL